MDDLGAHIWHRQPIWWRQRIVDESTDLNALSWIVYHLNAATLTGCLRNQELREESRARVQQQFETKQVKVLEIGPGNDFSSLVYCADSLGIQIDKRFKRSYSYEPFEIADFFKSLGIDYRVDVMEIDPLSVAMISQQDHILIERFEGIQPEELYNRLFMGVERTKVLEDQIRRYNQLRDPAFEMCMDAHVVQIPEDIRCRVNVFQGNIETDKIQEYDAIFFHAVDIYFKGGTKPVLRKISDSLIHGGFLFTSDIGNPHEYGFAEVSRVKWKKDSVCYQKI